MVVRMNQNRAGFGLHPGDGGLAGGERRFTVDDAAAVAFTAAAFHGRRGPRHDDVPRNLKAPTFCRFSHWRNNALPASPSSVAHVITGVRWAMPAIRRAAASLS